MLLASEGSYPPVAMARDKYEQETTKLFQHILKPGMNVIDIGAHVGYFSLTAARLVGPSGKVYSFEPASENFELLVRNIELNGYGNIAAAKSAVSSHVGALTLYLADLDSGRHSTYNHGLPEKGRATVDSTTVDSFLAIEGWPKIGLVKIDVEGAELDVLEGMNQLAKQSDDLRIIMEFNPELLKSAGTDPYRFLEKTANWRLKMYCIDDSEGLVPVEGVHWPELVRNLIKSESSVNIFCTAD